MDQITRQDDYDSPWKQAIEAMFPEFMGFYFPHASAAIDWRQPHRFLEQELRKISQGPLADTGWWISWPDEKKKVFSVRFSVFRKNARRILLPETPTRLLTEN